MREPEAEPPKQLRGDVVLRMMTGEQARHAERVLRVFLEAVASAAGL